MTLIEILLIIVIHWISDFVMQDEKWALGKSKDVGNLINHTMTYSAIFGLAICFILPVHKTISGLYLSTIFFLVTFIFHTATDYFTSRVVSKRFGKEEIFTLTIDSKIYEPGDVLDKDNTYSYIIMSKIEPSFANKHNYRVKLYNSIPNFGAFTIIGFDQVLHYIQLFTTYYVLVNI